MGQRRLGEVLFPFQVVSVLERPDRGANGFHRVGLRHGVATVTAGRRTAKGVIFHGAA